MKTKKTFILLFAFLVMAGLSAQESSEDGVDCNRTLSVFAQSAKVKDYTAAKEHYDVLRESCPPNLSKAIYQYGTRMFNDFLSKAETQEDKVKYSKALIENYEAQLENYPEKDKKRKANYYKTIAQAKFDVGIGTPEEQYQDFDEAWQLDSYNDPKALYTYFSLLIDLQDEGKKSLEDVFFKYDELMNFINEQEAEKAEDDASLQEKKARGETLTDDEKRQMHNNEIYLTNYMKIKESIDAKIGSRADCDNLIPLYTRSFDERKNDEDWLKIAASRLSDKRCTDGDMFFKITEALHEIDPSAKSAKYLGQLAAIDGNINRAIEYYQESIKLEENKMDKAKVYYQIGNMYAQRGNKSAARQNYRSAVQNNPSLGAAYLKIADLVHTSANDCGESVFEKQAVNWLAAQYAERAAAVDPSLKSTAGKASEAYRSRAPSKADIFKEGKAGETINIKCWISESVKVPNL